MGNFSDREKRSASTKQILAERLFLLRKNAKISRAKVADYFGITRAALEYYEKGKRTPDVGLLVQLAKYYGVTVDYLLGVDNKDSSARDWLAMRFERLC